MLGTRAIWHDGWKAAALIAGGAGAWGDFERSAGSSSTPTKIRAECHDLAAEHPEKLQEMIALWWEQAGQYQALPLEDRDAVEILADANGRRSPSRAAGTSTTRAAPRCPESVAAEHPQPLVHHRRRGRHPRRPEAERRALLARRPVRRPRPVRQGRQLKYVYNWVGVDEQIVESDRADPDRSRRPLGLVRARGRHDAGRGDPDASTSATSKVGEAGSRPSPASSRRRRGPQHRQGRRRAGHRRLPGRFAVAVRRRDIERAVSTSAASRSSTWPRRPLAFARD